MSSSNNDNDIGEKFHRRVTPFDAPWMKHTDSDATTDYPRKLADSYIQNGCVKLTINLKLRLYSHVL
jgi:hypothetical protein